MSFDMVSREDRWKEMLADMESELSRIRDSKGIRRAEVVMSKYELDMYLKARVGEGLDGLSIERLRGLLGGGTLFTIHGGGAGPGEDWEEIDE